MILHEDFTNPPRAGWAGIKIGADSSDKSAQRIGMMVLLTSAASVIAGILWALSWLRS